MSKKAAQYVLEQFNEEDEVLFEDAVLAIKGEFGVKENTAQAYIYQADNLKVEWRNNREYRVVVEDDGSGERQAKLGNELGESAKRSAGDATGETFKFLPVLEKTEHPKIPESRGYFARRLFGHKTDLQVATRAWSADTPAGVENLLLTGPPGTGKNALFEEVAAQTNRPLVRIPCSKDIRYEDVVGHYAPAEDGSGFEWKDGLLTMAVRYGWIVIIDEINMAPGDITSALHQITEGTPKLVVRQTGEVVDPHPEFRVGATKNPYGHAGTKRMNEAFLSRWRVVEIPYLDRDAEVNVLKNSVDGLSGKEDELKNLVDFANKAREEYRDGTMSTAISTRHLQRVCDYIGDDFLSLKEAVKASIVPTLSEDDKDVFERVVNVDSSL